MKKNIMIALIGAATLAPVAAHAENYLGVSAGRSDQKFTVFNEVELKDKTTAYKVFGGHQFTQYVGIEAGYVDMGEGESNGATARPRSAYVAATGTLPLTESFALTGKAGAASSRTEIKDVFTRTEKNTGLMLGVGATFAITPTMLAVVEYENFGKVIDENEYDHKVNVLSAGLRFKF